MAASAGRDDGLVIARTGPARDFGGSLFRTFCATCLEPQGSSFRPFCHRCGGMSEIEYDLSSVEVRDSENPYLRFRDLLPVANSELLPRDARFTPTVHAAGLGGRLDMLHLYLKDETGLPTGTTKDRMAAVALPYLREHGVRGFCAASTGNSSTAYAHAISYIPGLVMYLFTAAQFRDRVQVAGGEQVVSYVLRDATFAEAFDAAGEFAKAHGLVAEQGFFNPGRREGLKLGWLEAAEQVPRPIDWYVQAVSSAMGVYGAFKGAKELRALGRISRLPRLLCVQQETCAPMVSAWADGSDHIRAQDVVERPVGIAESILRGNPSRAYPHVRRIVLESGGTFVAVSEGEICEARELVEDLEQISPCFSAAAAVAGVMKARRLSQLRAEDTVLINLTGSDRRERAPLTGARWLRRSERGWVAEGPAEGPVARRRAGAARELNVGGL